MWLLNSDSLDLKEFISHKQAPPYAILSHTWGDEEVSFRELQDEPREHIEGKRGFNKIRLCCQQAASDDLEWVWIDTCCIDKRSSAELSEAINSMFQWYKSAVLCYVYLFDVSDDIESNLAKSRWVTRGWTLQELIAPQEVVFYSNIWEELGTRSKLSSLLASITRIDESFLTGRSVEEASIAQRMSWAAKRKTSRDEDVAYCLLGIFNVNLPMIYGEGLKAFRRLQEQLVHEYPQDYSLFAWGKFTKELSNVVHDEEQIWGSKPLDLQFEPNQETEKFFGLLAESPDDFEDASQVVFAPGMKRYFHRKPVAPILVGSNVYLELPIYFRGLNLAIHTRRPPIVSLILILYVILPCGWWNNSQFCHASIPVFYRDNRCFRIYEIIADDLFVYPRMMAHILMRYLQEVVFAPQLMDPLHATDLVQRRVTSSLYYFNVTHHTIEMLFLGDRFRIPGSLHGPIINWAFLKKDGYVLSILLSRLNALDHSHKDLTQGRNCGQLRVGYHIFRISSERNPKKVKFRMLTKSSDGEAPTISEEQFHPECFKTLEDASHFGFKKPVRTTCAHDMAVPRGEWSFSIIGLADVYVSLERIYLDEDNSNDDLDGDTSHRFIDALDIVVDDRDASYPTTTDGTESSEAEVKRKIFRTRRITRTGKIVRTRRIVRTRMKVLRGKVNEGEQRDGSFSALDRRDRGDSKRSDTSGEGEEARST